MADFDFLPLAYDQLGKLVALSLLGCAALFLLSGARLRSLFTDPFHFYYTFTFGTAYAIVALLWDNDLLSPLSLLIVIGSGVLFLLSYRASRASRWALLTPLVVAIAPGRSSATRFAFVAIAIYLFITVFYVYQAGFGFLQESRFEANRGVGSLSRIIDAIRLYVISYAAITLSRRARTGRPWILYALGATALALLGALVNGAKFALLEMVYAAIVAISASQVAFRPTRFAIMVTAVLATTLTIAFAFVVLSFNLSASGIDLSSSGQYIGNNNIVLEMAANRIIANADMYYLSLPNDVITRIDTGNPLLLMLAPFLGSSTLTSIVGFDINNFDVGRAIWLYWYPGDPIMRGPTNHFDLTGYRYFGLVGGWIFSAWVGFLLGQFEKLKTGGNWTDAQAALAATFWLVSLIMLLHPAIGFARLLDLVLILGTLKIASMRWRAQATPHPSTPIESMS